MDYRVQKKQGEGVMLGSDDDEREVDGYAGYLRKGVKMLASFAVLRLFDERVRDPDVGKLREIVRSLQTAIDEQG
jgi:hypothetical protein